MIKTTEPGEAVYTYAYDAINRVTSQTDPLQGVTTYAYDAVGNLTGSIDAEGAATAYTYDAIDRLSFQEQTVVKLRYFEDMKLEEIAQVLGENVNTVKARLYRTLRKLRVVLEEE